MDVERIYKPAPKWVLKLIAVAGLAAMLTSVVQLMIGGFALAIVGVAGLILTA